GQGPQGGTHPPDGRLPLLGAEPRPHPSVIPVILVYCSMRAGSKSIPVIWRFPACALMCTTMSIVILNRRLMTSNSKPAPSMEAFTINASWSHVWAVLPAWQLVMEPGCPEAQFLMK